MFRAFDPSWVLEDDGSIVVVNKPVGVPCMAPRKGIVDDLPARLAEGLGIETLGVHSRLDRETSGVIAYARDAKGNALLAGDTRKIYRCAVERWKGGDAVLDAPIDGKPATTHVRVVRRERGRVLLEAELRETGRTHQIRRHLAERGSPIAGDLRYGGPPAPRMLLYSVELRIGGRSVRAEPDDDLARWLGGADFTPFDDPSALARAFRRALHRRYWLWLDPDTTAFRVFHAEADGAPGLAVDLYGEHLVAHLYDEAIPHEETIVETLASFESVAGIYVKRRPRQANTLVDTRRGEVAPAKPVWGTAAPEAMVILESGIEHSVRLGDGLSTGIFLDQRDARERIRRESEGALVLNLFAYTGGFSLAAAVGGASSVASVDVSRGALDVAVESMARIDYDAHETWRHDCFEAIKIMAKKDRRFDIVVADPPTYSKHKKSRWTSGKDWVRLAEACFSVCAPKARLLMSSNDARMTRKRMRGHLREGAQRAGVSIARMVDLRDPIDFPTYGEHPLKRVWIELSS